MRKKKRNNDSLLNYFTKISYVDILHITLNQFGYITLLHMHIAVAFTCWNLLL